MFIRWQTDNWMTLRITTSRPHVHFEPKQRVHIRKIIDDKWHHVKDFLKQGAHVKHEFLLGLVVEGSQC